MKDTEILKAALEKAITEQNEIIIKEVAIGCGIKHIKSNDLLVMCRNLIRKNPEYRLVKFVKPGQPDTTASLLETGVITRMEYDTGTEDCYQD